MAKKKAVGHDRAFLDDIAAHPKDDTPRLIYADWLDDHDQHYRAEFIRLQCRLASLSEYDPERIALEQREADLLLVYGKEWRSVLPVWAADLRYHAFRRGFIDRVSATVTDFLNSGAGLFSAVPAHEFHLRGIPNRLGEVAQSPLLARLTALELRGMRLEAGPFRALLASPHLGNLESLSLAETWSDRAEMDVLAAWPGLAKIQRLDLSEFRLPIGALTNLAKGRLDALSWLNLAYRPGSSDLPGLLEQTRGLRHLDLSRTPVTIEAARTLELLPSLTSLSLRQCRLTSKALAPLCSSATAKRLESLNLSGAYLNGQSPESLPWWNNFERLRRLVLASTDLSAPNDKFFSTAAMANLVQLDLQSCRLGGREIRCLASSPQLAGLAWLDLSDNHVGNDGAKALAESPYLRNLQYLDLDRCLIGKDGIEALAASQNLAKLRCLRLNSNNIGADGIKALAESPHLGELRELELSSMPVTKVALRTLLRSPHLRELRRLRVAYNSWNERDTELTSDIANPKHLPRLLVLQLAWTTIDLAKLNRPVEL